MRTSLNDNPFTARSRRPGIGISPRLRRSLPVLWTTLLLAHTTALSAQESDIPSIPLEPAPIYHVQSPAGDPVGWYPRKPVAPKPGEKVSIPFEAITGSEWPPGLVPVYVRQTKEDVWLSRRPRTGWENWNDPAFFALPPEDEPETGRIAGRWEAQATREDGSREFLVLELSMADGKVFGRFNQNTDHRYAFITGGTFQSNQLVLSVEYEKDRYRLQAEWKDDRLAGEWFHEEGTERGTWNARRSSKPVLPDATVFPLKLEDQAETGSTFARVWAWQESESTP